MYVESNFASEKKSEILNYFILKKTLCTLVFLFISTLTFSQEEFKHFRVCPALSHTYIPFKTDNGIKSVIVSSLGLDIEYWFNEKWGIGFLNDIELENFKVKETDLLFTNREYPLVITIDGFYRVYKDWILALGTGVEFEQTENLFVVRAGVEYEIKLANHWDLSPTFIYDYRSNHLNTMALGIGIGKRF